MDVKFKINKNRRVNCSRYHIGTVGENNVTTFLFEYPEELQDFSLSLTISNSNGSFSIPVLNDTATLPSYALTDEVFYAQVVFTKPNGDIWKSDKVKFMLYNSLDDSGVNIFDVVKSEQREADRHELGGAITNITGNDCRDSDWDELIDLTNKLPIQTEQDVIDLTTYSDLTNAFRQATTAPSLLTGYYNLDKDESGEGILIKLPYLYTPNAKYSENTPISSAVVECGFDVSASGNSVCHGTEISMFNQGNSARNLVKLKLTGLECVSYGATMFSGMPKLAELEIIEGENFAESYMSSYYYGFFRFCTKLEAVKGTPLDMSRGTTYGHMFYNCESLRYVRFKPGTICHDLDLSTCPALIKKYEATTDDPGTLLSIINGVRDYTGSEDPIKITFSTFTNSFIKTSVKSYLSIWRCKKDESTGLYVFSDDESDNTMWTILTTVKGVIIT